MDKQRGGYWESRGKRDRWGERNWGMGDKGRERRWKGEVHILVVSVQTWVKRG